MVNTIQIARIRTLLSNYPEKLPILSEEHLAKARATILLKADPGRTNRRATVIVPLLTINNEPSIIFTRRSTSVNTHKGQISFPGGHVESGESNTEAAIREMREELAVGPLLDKGFSYDEKSIEILGETAILPAITGTPVQPLIGFLHHPNIDLAPGTGTTLDKDYFNPNRSEVDCVFHRTVKELIASEVMEEVKNSKTGYNYTAPCYPCDEGYGKIWGLTAMILHPVLKRILQPALGGGDSERPRWL